MSGVLLMAPQRPMQQCQCAKGCARRGWLHSPTAFAESGLEVGVAFSPGPLTAVGSLDAYAATGPYWLCGGLEAQGPACTRNLATHRARCSDLGGGAPPILGRSTPGRRVRADERALRSPSSPSNSAPCHSARWSLCIER